MATGRIVWTRTDHANTVTRVQFSPDGKTVASGGFDGMIHLRDAGTGRIRHALDNRDKIASFLCARPNLSYHVVSVAEEGRVASIQDIAESGLRINAGFFVFKTEMFNYIHKGEELVQEPFHRLIAEDQLLAYPYNGFWMSMDTFKDKQRLDDIYSRGNAPWELWANRATVRKAG